VIQGTGLDHSSALPDDVAEFREIEQVTPYVLVDQEGCPEGFSLVRCEHVSFRVENEQVVNLFV
jgi:hypothetical protein